MYHLPFWRKWHEILSLSTNTSTIVICIQIKIILIYFLGLFSWSIFTQLVSLSSVDKSELLNSHSESCKCQWLNMAVGALRYFPPLPVCHFILTENKLIFFQSNICFMLKEHHLIKFSAGRCLLVFFFSPPFLVVLILIEDLSRFGPQSSNHSAIIKQQLGCSDAVRHRFVLAMGIGKEQSTKKITTTKRKKKNQAVEYPNEPFILNRWCLELLIFY